MPKLKKFNAERVEEIADRLRQARAVTRFNQTEFAERVGLSQNRLSQYETAERPLTLDAAIAICEEFGFSLDWLYLGDGTMLPHGLWERVNTPRAR